MNLFKLTQRSRFHCIQGFLKSITQFYWYVRIPQHYFGISNFGLACIPLTSVITEQPWKQRKLASHSLRREKRKRQGDMADIPQVTLGREGKEQGDLRFSPSKYPHFSYRTVKFQINTWTKLLAMPRDNTSKEPHVDLLPLWGRGNWTNFFHPSRKKLVSSSWVRWAALLHSWPAKWLRSEASRCTPGSISTTCHFWNTCPRLPAPHSVPSFPLPVCRALP